MDPKDNYQTVKTENDLQEVLELNPNISIKENSDGSLLIKDHEDRQHKSLIMNLSNNPYNIHGYSFVTCQIPTEVASKFEFTYINFDDNRIRLSGAGGNDIPSILKTVRAGLHLMQIWKQISEDEKERIKDHYWYNIKEADLDSTNYGNSPSTPLLIQKIIEVIDKELED